MLSSIFGKTADVVDRRFLLGILVPCFGFAVAIASLVITACGWGVALGKWQSISSSQQWLAAGGFTLVVFFVASMVSSLMNLLIAFWEGYTWPRWLRRAGVRRQRGRFERIAAAIGQPATTQTAEDTLARDYLRTRIKREYPDGSQAFLPTRLGNALASAEGYSRRRYGLDSVLFWPRQYLLLPEGDRKLLDDARLSMDQLVIVATLAAGVGFVVLLMAVAPPLAELFGSPQRHWLPAVVWIPSATGSVLLALLAYRAAVTSAVAFGDLVRSVSDLYRWKLVSEMNLDAPRSGAEEKKFWEALGQFIFIGGVDQSNQGVLRYSTLVDETIQVIGQQPTGGKVETPPPPPTVSTPPPLRTPPPPPINPWDHPSALRCAVLALIMTLATGILVLLIIDTSHFLGW